MELDRHKGVKIGTLAGVREYSEKYPVEIWVHAEGRLTVVAENEGGFNFTQVDFWDMSEWLRMGPSSGRVEGGFAISSAQS